MSSAAREFSEDPCSSLKRGNMVRAARNLLSAVTRLLILADMVDVHLLLKSLRVVSIWLNEQNKIGLFILLTIGHRILFICKILSSIFVPNFVLFLGILGWRWFRKTEKCFKPKWIAGTDKNVWTERQWINESGSKTSARIKRSTIKRWFGSSSSGTKKAFNNVADSFKSKYFYKYNFKLTTGI